VPDSNTPQPAGSIVAAVFWFVTALMGIAVVYALWVVAQNWSHIGV
jgi:hypothetical protein